ncbi:hypothetical protein [Streptomyces sp. NPDC101149]|uniref:hypothetical protein n=1 Tax=Streptomyces sp. NPDC101149 TaxID=3366113 RepID=UPI00382AAF30
MTAPTTGQWLRTAGERIYVGSGRLFWLLARKVTGRARTSGQGVRAWLVETPGLNWLFRAGLLLLGALLLKKVIVAVAGGLARRVDAAPWLMWPLVIAWLIAAYRVGRPDWPPPKAREAESEVTVEREDGEPHQVPSAPGAAELVAAVRQIGTPHAHLAALAEHLGTTGERVREGCAAAGLEVTAVRMRGRGSSTGVRGDVLPPLPSPAPECVVAAGQPANNDNNNASGDEPREGVRVQHIEGGLIVYDLSDSQRHHVIRKS